MNKAMGQILFGFAIIAASVEIFHIRRNTLMHSYMVHIMLLNKTQIQSRVIPDSVGFR